MPAIREVIAHRHCMFKHQSKSHVQHECILRDSDGMQRWYRSTMFIFARQPALLWDVPLHIGRCTTVA